MKKSKEANARESKQKFFYTWASVRAEAGGDQRNERQDSPHMDPLAFCRLLSKLSLFSPLLFAFRCTTAKLKLRKKSNAELFFNKKTEI